LERCGSRPAGALLFIAKASIGRFCKRARGDKGRDQRCRISSPAESTIVAGSCGLSPNNRLATNRATKIAAPTPQYPATTRHQSFAQHHRKRTAAGGALATSRQFVINPQFDYSFAFSERLAWSASETPKPANGAISVDGLLQPEEKPSHDGAMANLKQKAVCLTQHCSLSAALCGASPSGCRRLLPGARLAGIR